MLKKIWLFGVFGEDVSALMISLKLFGYLKIIKHE